jgi:ketosteroid isomerase-like protein
MGPTDQESSYRAIEGLIATYAELVDDGDFPAVGRLLADATFVADTGSVTGRDAIEKMLRDNVIVYADGTPRTKHVTTNLAIEVGRSCRHSDIAFLLHRPTSATGPRSTAHRQRPVFRSLRAPRRAPAFCRAARSNRSRRRCEPTSAPLFHGPLVVPPCGTYGREVLARRRGRRWVLSALALKGGNEPVRRTPVGLRLRGVSSPFVEPAPVCADTKHGGPAARSCS